MNVGFFFRNENPLAIWECIYVYFLSEITATEIEKYVG